MEQYLLWFNILGFALLFAALGSTYIVYKPIKPDWLGSYLLYIIVYASFMILNTYRFFRKVYLTLSFYSMDTQSMMLALIVALLLFIVVPRFIWTLCFGNVTWKQRSFSFVMGILFLAMYIISVLFPAVATRISIVAIVYMNVYLGTVTLNGLIRLRLHSTVSDREDAGIVIPFLYMSCLLYYIVALQSVVMPMVVSETLNNKLNLFTSGCISFLWGALSLLYLFWKNPGKSLCGVLLVSESFTAQYRITPRERDVLGLLVNGKSNKEIGEALFVSPRTVETHIYNIYRKCSVKNKLELFGKIRDCPE